jgi:hypothetical protein
MLSSSCFIRGSIQCGLLLNHLAQVVKFGGFVEKPVCACPHAFAAVQRAGIVGEHGELHPGCQLFDGMNDRDGIAIRQMKIQNDQRWHDAPLSSAWASVAAVWMASMPSIPSNSQSSRARINSESSTISSFMVMG